MLGALLRRGERDIPPVTDIRQGDDLAFLEEAKTRLEMLEVVRLDKLASYMWRKRIAVPLAAVLTPVISYIDYWLLMLQRGNDDSAAGLTFVLLGILYGWVTQPKRQYTKAYKQGILPDLARLFGDFRYVIDGAIPVGAMQKSKILPSHDRYKTEDYFEGEYKGVRIAFSEVDFQQKRSSKNSTYYVSVFKGLAILLDMKTKRFYGHTVIDRDRGKIAEWFKEKTDKLKRANLVDPEFEKTFDVYTNDQVEARYLIDPLMIERLTGLQKEYEGKNITAAFYDSKMLVLVRSSHNHFEPASLHVPATDPRSVLNMKREIGEILSLIDRLALYDPNEVHGAGA